MNSEKRTIRNSSVRTVVVILALALCVGSGIFGMLNATELLTVSADQSATISPADSAVSPVGIAGDVSDSDTPSGPAEKPSETPRKAATRNGAGLIPMADPSPQEITLNVTHDLTMSDGRTVTTGLSRGLFYGRFRNR